MRAFSAKLLTAPKKGTWVEVPFDVKGEFGSARHKIKAVFNDRIEYRGTLVRMGGANHILGVRKEFLEQLGLEPGDIINVQLELDTEPRVVEVPDILKAELDKDVEIRDWFGELSYTHQKEYVNYIMETKKEDTRVRRVGKAIEMMRKTRKA